MQASAGREALLPISHLAEDLGRSALAPQGLLIATLVALALTAWIFLRMQRS
jgi:hypothetical protein